MFAVKEATSAIDLAELYVEVLEKSKTPVSSTVLDRFEEVTLIKFPFRLTTSLLGFSTEFARYLLFS